MEVDRRPIAAKRTYVTSTSPDVLPRHVPLVPLANTASFALEARRRPVAAARVGVSVASEAAGVSPTLDVLDVLAKANRPAQSFIATAAGAMEMSRRPKAARRVSPAIRPSKVRKETPAPNLADTAWAAMEARRRPRATKRAAKLRDSVDGDFVGQHSVLHPEQVGEFALDANQLAEHAAWRLRMVNAAVDEAGDKVLAAMTDRALSDLARLNLDKDAAAKTAGGDAPNPFAALERMLDARMSSESLLVEGGVASRRRQLSPTRLLRGPGARRERLQPSAVRKQREHVQRFREHPRSRRQQALARALRRRVWRGGGLPRRRLGRRLAHRRVRTRLREDGRAGARDGRRRLSRRGALILTPVASPLARRYHSALAYRLALGADATRLTGRASVSPAATK